MSKKEKKERRLRAVVDYVTGKGFYKVVGLCLAVVVLAAWFISSSLNDDISGLNVTSAPETASIPKVVNNPDPADETGLSDQLLDGYASDAATATDDPVGTANPDGETQPADTVARLLFVMPVSGEVTLPYSDKQPVYSPTLRDWRVHAAVDIAGEVGTPVRAVAEGTVVSVQSDILWGTTIVIKHPNGYESKYCNLGAKPTVNENTVVEAGQVIGSIGTSAQAEISDAPHLHFALYKDGNPVDPIAEMSAVPNE